MRNRVAELGLLALAIVAAVVAEWLIASLFVLGAVTLYEWHSRDSTKIAVVCCLGSHVIGNEPYSFFSDSVKKEEYVSKPYCLKCKAFLDAEVDRFLAETNTFLKEEREKSEARQREWDALPIDAKRAALEDNLSKWATKGDDGVWRRKDSNEVVELNADGTHVKRIDQNPAT